MNSQEIINKLKEAGFKNGMLHHEDYPDSWKDEYKQTAGECPKWDSANSEPYREWQASRQKFYESKMSELGVGSFTTVDQKGGEGEGEEYWVIHHFTDHDSYIKEEGFYTSFDGTDFDSYEFQAVSPVQKTVTVYE